MRRAAKRLRKDMLHVLIAGEPRTPDAALGVSHEV
jgi:hypothetical protein